MNLAQFKKKTNWIDVMSFKLFNKLLIISQSKNKKIYFYNLFKKYSIKFEKKRKKEIAGNRKNEL